MNVTLKLYVALRDVNLNSLETLLKSCVFIGSRSTYQNQEEDQLSRGLGAAVTLKSRGVAYKVLIVNVTVVAFHPMWNLKNVFL